MAKSDRGVAKLILLGIAHSLNHSLFVVAPPLLVLILSGLNASKAEIGLVSTISSFIYGAGALVGGPLGDKIGEIRTIAMSLAFSGCASFIMLMAEVAGEVYIYALALMTMAIWASLYHPTSNSLISKDFKSKMSESMGLHGLGGNVGLALTPTIAYLIGVSWGWSLAFVFFGVLCIVAASLIFTMWNQDGEKRIKNDVTILDALKIRQVWILLFFNVAIGFFMKGINLFFPMYLIENKGISPEWAAIAYTLLLAIGVPAQWIGGKTADRIGSKTVLIATSLGVLVGLMGLLWVPVPIFGVALFILLYGFSFNAHQPALNSLAGLVTPLRYRGAIFGIYFFTSFGIGSISQFLAGIIGDLYSLDSAFLMLTGFALIALLLSFKLPEKKENNTI